MPPLSIVYSFPAHHLKKPLSARDGILKAVIPRIVPNIVYEPVLYRLQHGVEELLLYVLIPRQVFGRVASSPESASRIPNLVPGHCPATVELKSLISAPVGVGNRAGTGYGSLDSKAVELYT